MEIKFTRKKRPIVSKAVDHQLLMSLINSMADAVIAVDEDVNIVLYNAAALNIFDVNTIRSASNLNYIFQPINQSNKSVSAVELVKGTKIPYSSRNLRIKYSDASMINIYLSIAPVRLGYGAKGPTGYVLVLRDITHEKSLEEERDEFISVVSHELRTPIAIAEGNLSNAMFFVDKPGVDKSVQQALEEAHSQILLLADMINDLSTLSRADRDKLNINIETVDIKSLMEDLANTYRQQAADKGLELKYSVDPKAVSINSSRLYLREILQNFLTNALKYTHKGYISISAENNSKGVCFTVSDSGIGISKSDKERVFDKFFRSEDYRTRQSNGTGLGLYVTMKLTRLIRAQLELESTLDEGSTFSLIVPNLN